MAQTQAFISIKDHKDDFENNTKGRLINPAKGDLGKVSKSILDRINTEIREQTIANQWRNSNDTIAFFNSINDKNRHTFLSLDIVDFYPSISQKLVDQAITWGRQFTPISDSDTKIIKHARKSLLCNNGQAWTNRNNATMYINIYTNIYIYIYIICIINYLHYIVQGNQHISSHLPIYIMAPTVFLFKLSCAKLEKLPL